MSWNLTKLVIDLIIVSDGINVKSVALAVAFWCELFPH